MNIKKIGLTSLCLFGAFALPTQAEESAELALKPSFAIETKMGLGTPVIAMDPGFVGNATALFSFSQQSAWVYFLDYGWERNYYIRTGMVSDFETHIDIQALMLGYRYYFDFNWPMSPYFTLSLGALAITDGPSSPLFLPAIAGGIGGDYMLTPHIGLNIEANLLVFLLQLKAGIKYLF